MHISKPLIILILSCSIFAQRCADEKKGEEKAPCNPSPCKESAEKSDTKTDEVDQKTISLAGFDGCCSTPCQHKGICLSKGDNYWCDCTGTGYVGENCEQPLFSTRLRKMISLSMDNRYKLVTSYPLMWSIINAVPFLHRRAMKYVYMSRHNMVPNPPSHIALYPFTTVDVHFNRTFYTRAIPPLPAKCPTPMGITGPAVLPTPHEIFERIFVGKDFKPCPKLTNQLFISWAQHFTYGFFKTLWRYGTGYTWGLHGVDLSQVYGEHEAYRKILRTGQGGKLKSQMIDDEEFPPDVSDAPLPMVFHTIPEMNMFQLKNFQSSNWVPPKRKFAIGHKDFNMNYQIFSMAVIWLREHNRVCDVLQKEHPTWSDNQLYETARLILTALQIKITLTEYVQHLSQYYIHLTYDPALIHYERVQYSNRIHEEFNHLYHWHNMVSPTTVVNGKEYNISDYFYSDPVPIFEQGMDKFFEALVDNIAGQMGPKNFIPYFESLVTTILEGTRANHMPGLNAYRSYYGFTPHKTFLDLTGDPEIAKELEYLYKDVNAVEFYPGLMAERHGRGVTSVSMVAFGGAWAIKGLISNPVGSPGWWKPSTFGGQVGMDIITKSDLHDFICRNLKNKCEGFQMRFAVKEMPPVKKKCPKVKCCCKPLKKAVSQ